MRRSPRCQIRTIDDDAFVSGPRWPSFVSFAAARGSRIDKLPSFFYDRKRPERILLTYYTGT